MPDVGNLTRLSWTLISLFPSQGDARALAERAELNTGNIDLGGPPRVYMWNIVQEASKTGVLERLVDAALQSYPDHPDLVDVRNNEYAKLTAPIESPGLSGDQWQPRLGIDRAEKIMGATSTFLPISFLEIGVARSRSVARIVLPDLSTGTGFLVAGNLLVTNHHVIPDVETARGARVQFNFQESSSGRPEDIEEFVLDPDSAFRTSPMEGGDDYTIVRLADDANTNWGALPLGTSAVAVGDRVMIVQHPEGGFKKLALHHNVVTYADDRLLQYFTDTLPGSSGSPVFDHAWRVVGLHHAGGDIPEPGAGRIVFRNEGISIGRLVHDLDELAGP